MADLDGQKYRCVIKNNAGESLVIEEAELQIKMKNLFTDVAKGEYYYDAVLWAYENGIASGLIGNWFGTEESCTRGQVATFLYRAYQ